MVSYARKYDVSENLNHYRLDGIRYKIRENVSTRKGHIGLDARKFSCAKISTFTVHTVGSMAFSVLLKRKSITWVRPAMTSIRLSLHRCMCWMANGSSSGSGDRHLERSNTLAVFSLYSTSNVTGYKDGVHVHGYKEWFWQSVEFY